MITVTIDYWGSEKLFTENKELYDKLMGMDEKFFVKKQKTRWELDENGKTVNKGYESFVFFINKFDDIDRGLYTYCSFEPVETLEMMGGAKINTGNVFEAVKRNQIMLPNNLMLECKELYVETNACTNSINSLLNEGWKIIAVLPQHQQSRPDYILGKF